MICFSFNRVIKMDILLGYISVKLDQHFLYLYFRKVHSFQFHERDLNEI